MSASDKLLGAVVRSVGEPEERGVVQATHGLGNGFWLLVLLPNQQLRSWRHDDVEVVWRGEHGEIDALEVGETYEFLARVRATVVDKSHGASVELELETRDYLDGRTVCLDLDEIESAEKVG